MTGANVFLPLFDPIVDTFEAMRQRSAFCLVVILGIALRVDRRNPDYDNLCNQLLNEAHLLAAKSLFVASPQLETVQAMVLLATYSERNWLAICHARQMGQVLELDRLLPKISDLAQPGIDNAGSPRKKPGYSAQAVRTWLILYHVEQEAAAGMGRESGMAPIPEKVLRSFLNHPRSVISDIRIVSTIEVVQLRGKSLLLEIRCDEVTH